MGSMLRSTEVLERSRKLELEDRIAASGIHKTHLFGYRANFKQTLAITGYFGT